MNTISPSPTLIPKPPSESEGERKTRAQGAVFAGIFAQFAQQTAMSAGGGGRLALNIGKRAPGEHAAKPASAEGRPGLNGDAHRAPGAGDEPTRGGAPQPGHAGRTATGGTPSERAPRGSTAQAPMQTEAKPAPGAERQPERADGPPAAGGDRSAQSNASAGAPAHAAPQADPAAPTGAGAAAQGAAAGAAQTGAASRAVAPVSAGSVQPMLGAGGPAQAGGAGVGRMPRPAAPPPVARSQQAFRAQLVQGLAAALRRGTGDVVLKLRPASLGDLRVQLRVQGTRVDARIRPSTVQAQRLLESSVDSLRAAFESKGLHVGRIEIEAAPSAPAHGAGHALSQGQGEPGGDGPGVGGENSGGEPRDSASPRDPAGDGAGIDASDEVSIGGSAFWGGQHPGVVYGVADGAARIVMVDALA